MKSNRVSNSRRPFFRARLMRFLSINTCWISWYLVWANRLSVTGTSALCNFASERRGKILATMAGKCWQSKSDGSLSTNCANWPTFCKSVLRNTTGTMTFGVSPQNWPSWNNDKCRMESCSSRPRPASGPARIPVGNPAIRDSRG